VTEVRPLAQAFVRIRPAITREDAQALEDQAARFREWADELDAFRAQFVVAPDPAGVHCTPEHEPEPVMAPLRLWPRRLELTDGRPDDPRPAS
jgi:hypothetical protein